VNRTVETIPLTSFASPLLYRGALPLRVAVYGVVAAAVRNGIVPAGGLLPPEAEMAGAFGVSRTVMREALILLEEDGLIRTHRGVGRFVADVVPEIGLEALQPIEKMLTSESGSAEVRRLRHEQEPTTDFTGRWLALESGGASVMWESLVTLEDEPVALAQEWVAAPGSAPPGPSLPTIVDARETDRVSMLAVLQQALGPALGPAVCHISSTSAGAERAQSLGIDPSSPLLLVTQAVARDGVRVYVAKHLIRPEAGHLTVIQA